MVQATHPIANTEAPTFRAVRLGPRDFIIDRKPDGTIYLSSPHKLPAYPKTITQCLVNWAERTPDTVYMADRVNGAWRKTTSADTLARVRRIGTALLKRKLSPDRPVAILSGNELEHHWLGLAAMHIEVDVIIGGEIASKIERYRHRKTPQVCDGESRSANP